MGGHPQPLETRDPPQALRLAPAKAGRPEVPDAWASGIGPSTAHGRSHGHGAHTASIGPVGRSGEFIRSISFDS